MLYDCGSKLGYLQVIVGMVLNYLVFGDIVWDVVKLEFQVDQLLGDFYLFFIGNCGEVSCLDFLMKLLGVGYNFVDGRMLWFKFEQ